MYECALRLVYNDKIAIKSLTIHERIIQVLLTVIFKVKSGVGSKIITESFKFKK